MWFDVTNIVEPPVCVNVSNISLTFEVYCWPYCLLVTSGGGIFFNFIFQHLPTCAPMTIIANEWRRTLIHLVTNLLLASRYCFRNKMKKGGLLIGTYL